jgi:Apea-like HEPN
MARPEIIPPEKRAPQLRNFLVDQSRIVAEIKKQKRDLIPDLASPFLYLIYPWLGEPINAEQKVLLAARRRDFEAAGFKGNTIREILEGILRQDEHLRECCVGPAQLAHCFDLGFIMSAAAFILADARSERLDELFQQFETTIYSQGRFKAISLCHIFNFQSDAPSLKFGNVRIERLDGPTIPMVLGETSAISFIHPPGTGEYFVVSELEGPCDEHIKWIFEEKNKAELFMHVLQYFKDGVVHIDYAVPHFMPQWVNQIRKGGIFFIGNPRRIPYEGGRRFYSVLEPEKQAIARWWAAYQHPRIFQRIEDLRNSLRQAGLRAGEYFELNHSQEKPADRLVSLAIALEALFSPDDKGEFTFRISQSLSQLVGTTSDQRAAIFKETKRFYARRSELVHGQYDIDAYLQGRFVTHEECERWASPIRLAILRFLVLYLRGQNEREYVHRELSLAALNAEAAERLRTESDPDRFIGEFQG